MKMKTLIAAVAMAAAFAFSAVADDVWYEESGVTVSGTGAASVAYRSESETSAWLWTIRRARSPGTGEIWR